MYYVNNISIHVHISIFHILSISSKYSNNSWSLLVRGELYGRQNLELRTSVEVYFSCKYAYNLYPTSSSAGVINFNALGLNEEIV